MARPANKFQITNAIKKVKYILLLLIVKAISFAQISDSLFLEAFKNPKKYRIGGVTVQGAQFTDQNVITLLANITVGDEIPIPGDQITDAIKKLWKQSIFEDVQIILNNVIGNNAFLVIKVVERPRLSRFKFTGDVRKSDADDIRNRIRLLKE